MRQPLKTLGRIDRRKAARTGRGLLSIDHIGPATVALFEFRSSIVSAVSAQLETGDVRPNDGKY